MKLVKVKTPKADIARHYRRNFLLSVIATMILMILIFRIQFNPDADMQIEEEEQDVIEMEEVIQTEQDHTPPPPERPRDPEVVPDDEILEDEVFDFEGDLDDAGAGDLPPPPPPEDGEEEEEELEYFESVEDMPEIIGGMDALYEVLEYPEIAKQAGVEGRVVVQFIIDENGNVIDPQVIQGVGAGLDEAAVQAIQQVEFRPGRQRGRPVAVQYTIPINFRLEDAR